MLNEIVSCPKRALQVNVKKINAITVFCMQIFVLELYTAVWSKLIANSYDNRIFQLKCNFFSKVRRAKQRDKN